MHEELNSTKRFYFFQPHYEKNPYFCTINITKNVIYIWISTRAVTKSHDKTEEMSMEFKTMLLLFCSLSTWVLQSLCWQREVCQMPTPQLYLWRSISELQVWKELLSLRERSSIHGLHQWVASLCSGLSFLLLHLYLSGLLASFHVPLQSAITACHVFLHVGQAAKNWWAGFMSFCFHFLLLILYQIQEGDLGFLNCYQYFQPSVLNCTLRVLSVYKKTWSLIV